MNEDFRFFKKVWRNSKQRKEFQRVFKTWNEEIKFYYLSHFFGIRIEDTIMKVKVYTAEYSIKTAVYTDKGIYKFNLSPANDGRWDYIDAQIISRRTPLI